MESRAADPFCELVLGELDAVHRFALHLASSKDEAEELVQEAYLRAFRFRDTYRPGSEGPRPWLFKILHNLYRTRLDRQQRDPLSGDSVDALDGHPATPPALPPTMMDWDQVDERLKTAVHALPPALRTVLLLWAVDGLKYKEIADVLEVPLGTVMSRLYRARQTLIEQVADLGRELRILPAAEPAEGAGRAGGFMASDHG